jgi:hypothetical protein
MFAVLFEWLFIHLRRREMFSRLMFFCKKAQTTHEFVRNCLPWERELLSLDEAHFTTLCILRNIRRLELLGTQMIVSMTPKCLQRKEEGGPGGKQSPTFVVSHDVEKAAKLEHGRVCEVGIGDPSVQQLIFCRKIGCGLSILTFVRN